MKKGFASVIIVEPKAEIRFKAAPPLFKAKIALPFVELNYFLISLFVTKTVITQQSSNGSEVGKP